jgi:hypothetical protein
VAHVVADLVRAQLRQLHPQADAGRAAIAGKRSSDKPVHAGVERLDQRLWKWPRALARRRRL